MTLKEFIISAAIGVISATLPLALGFKADSFQYWFITLYTIFVCAVLRMLIESKPSKSVKKMERSVVVFGKSSSERATAVINTAKLTLEGKAEYFNYDALRLSNYRALQECAKNTEMIIINGFTSWWQVNVFSEAFIPSIMICEKCEESFVLPVKFILVCKISEIDSETFKELSKKFDIIH